MPKLFIDLILTVRITETYKILYNTTSKLPKTAKSTGFIQKAYYNKVTPSSAQTNGQFINKQD